MAGNDLSIRSIPRFEGIASSHLKKGETVQAALPVWLGGTYMPVVVGLIGGTMAGSVISNIVGERSIWLLLIGGVIGVYIGMFISGRRLRQHPVTANRRQVYLAVTDRRILIHENGSMGKPGGLRSELNRKALESTQFKRGGFFRPHRLTLTANGVDYRYEYSGLWRVPNLLESLGANV